VAPASHLLERAGRTVRDVPLHWVSPAAAQRALVVTGGITASAWGGTAQGSCRVVFGACPAQGLPGLSAKTGSSDFLLEEDGPHAKPGLQLPAKLFGGVFTAANGKRYAIAAMALRVREGKSQTLELRSSAPAEAALTLMRQMGVAGFTESTGGTGVTGAPAAAATAAVSAKPQLTSANLTSSQ